MSELTTNGADYVERRGSGSIKWDLAGANEIPLWVADMDFASPPAVIEALKRRLDHPLLGYTKADPNVPKAFAGWCERRQGWRPAEEGVFLGHSVLNAMTAIMLSLSDPGDGIVVQQPVYGPFSSIPGRIGRTLLVNDLLCFADGSWTFDFADLEALFAKQKPRILLLCSPHNPVSRVWNETELRTLANLCVMHDVILVADEIHADMILPGHEFVSVGKLAQNPAYAEHLVVVQAPSKSFNIPGLPCALIYIAGPALRKRFADANSQLGQTLVGVLNQIACEVGYSQGDAWMDQAISLVDSNYKFLAGYIERWRSKWPRWAGNDADSLLMSPAEGTYLAWVRVGSVQKALGIDTKTLQARIRGEAKVWLYPGTQFGEAGEGWLRINVGTSAAVLNEALTRVESYFDKVYAETAG